MIHFYMQRFKFIDFMVIEFRLFKKKKEKMKKNMAKIWKSFFQILCISHITHQPIFAYYIVVCLVLSTLTLLKVK